MTRKCFHRRLLAVLLATSVLPLVASGQTMQFSKPELLAKSTHGNPQIWFGDDGQLVVAQRGYVSDVSYFISISIWNKPPEETDRQDLPAIVVPESHFHPVLSRDASRIAYIDDLKRRLIVQDTGDHTRRQAITLDPKKTPKQFKIAEMAFVGPKDNALAILFEDGDLQIYQVEDKLERMDYWLDFTPSQWELPQSPLRMWGSDSFLFVASVLDKKLFRFPLQANGNFTHKTPTEIEFDELMDVPVAPFALNRKGSAIFSSSETQLSRWDPGSKEPAVLKERGDLRGIALVNESDFLEIGNGVSYCDTTACSPVLMDGSDLVIPDNGDLRVSGTSVAYYADRNVYFANLIDVAAAAEVANQPQVEASRSARALQFFLDNLITILLSFISIGIIIALLYLYNIRYDRWPWTRVAEILYDPTDSQHGFDLPSPKVPEDLVTACRDGNCVLFVGAGVSAPSGYPVWKEFVIELVNWASECQYIDAQTAREYLKETELGNGNLIADNIYSRVEELGELPAMYELLKMRFEPAPQSTATVISRYFTSHHDPNHIHDLLREIPVSAVLTTNFDQMLETSYHIPRADTYRDTESVLTKITKKEFFILKLYGDLQDQESVLIAPAQFEEVIGSNRAFSETIETLFRSRTMFFVGASLDGIETYLKTISLARGVQNNHYALVRVTDDTWRSRAEFLQRRYGITVLPFTTDGSFSEVETFLRSLSHSIGDAKNPMQFPEGELARLESITLKNLGPFDDQTIKFNSQWNLLLGDNGVGKSTVLRAIAVALCGEESSKFAGRLVKMRRENVDRDLSANVGSIILTTNRGTAYITDIALDPVTDKATIRSNTARPMEAEGWLSIGFPPLRSIGWSPVKSSSSESSNKSRPVADDVIPLLTGEPDPRLDKLKEWVVTLENKRGRAELKEPGGGLKYQRLREKLFEFVNAMIAPTHVEYRRIDENDRIIIETADGPIPLEAVSQGMASLIGWTGVLMQRMYEIYKEDVNPLERYALVLIDEIDAHMHPHWQQQLIQRLRDFFPNAQFIISTHSPLIVSGLSANEITRFVRNEEGKVEIKPIKPDMPFGYADQILTSDLFNLSTSLPVTTQRKVKRYEDLSRKERDPAEEIEYQGLLTEIQFLIPALGSSYQEKHDESVEDAQLMKTIGERINKLSPGDGAAMVSRGENLLNRIEGGEHDQS